MHRFKAVIKSVSVIMLTALAISACANKVPAVPLHVSAEFYNFMQPSFVNYMNATEAWLKHSREFLSEDKEQELAMNMPFERKPQQPNGKAILLVHGLGDSPFSFVDISRDLAEQGFYVQALLLPGHGSKAEDMMLPHYKDWQRTVNHYADQLKQDYQQVWLGGYSTGANLVTTYAIEHQGIEGMMLFSPGFESRALYLEKLAPVVASVWPYGWQSDNVNLVKYTSAPINGAVAYSESAEHVRELLAENTVDIPVFMVISEADSVVNPDAVKSYFTQQFTHQDSRLIWYGEQQFNDSRIITKSMNIPLFKISSGSHMSTLFKPCNFYYGLGGEKRMCNNGQGSDKQALCEQGEDVWYSAWGYKAEGKNHARLTWNPHYGHMLRTISQVVGS